MIKTVLAICGAICALTPSLAYIQPASAEQLPLCEARYSSDFQGGEYDYEVIRTVYYATRKIDSYESPHKAPRFCAPISQACVVTAGGVSIVYNDWLYDNLIPNYAPKYIGNRFSYGTYNSEIEGMFLSLYNLMGTTSQGTTIPGFKSGMTSYVNQHGYSINLPQVTGSYHNTNINYLKQQLQQEKMGVIFLHNFSIVTQGEIETKDGYDNIPHRIYEGDHAMAVYGYYDYYYYNANGALVNRDTYLCVQTGLPNTLELLNINNFCNVDDIYIVDIH